MFGPRNSAYAVNLTYETYRHTYIYTYISREISIEHPSVGLASLAQLVNMDGEIKGPFPTLLLAPANILKVVACSCKSQTSCAAIPLDFHVLCTANMKEIVTMKNGGIL